MILTRILKTTGVFLSTLTLCCVPARALDLTGLSNPKSVIYAEKSGEYFISNINGIAEEKDGNGFITKADNKGLVVVMQFITSGEDAELNSPTGLCLIENALYVADIDQILAFDSQSGSYIRSIPLEGYGGKYLSDIAATSDGKIYASDAGANMIFMIEPDSEDAVSVLYAGDDLDGPNSLIVDAANGGLIVVSQTHGRIMRVSFKGSVELLKGGGEHLGGIVLDRRGDLYISSVTRGEIYKIDNSGGGNLSLFQSGLHTPSDMTYNPQNNEIIVPLTSDNKVISVSLK